MSVYVVSDGKNYKIGYTDEAVKKRIDSLQTGNANKLTLIHHMEGGRSLEKLFHKAFESKRLNGEWFNLSDEDIQIIKEWICPHCGAQKNLLPTEAEQKSPTPIEPITNKVQTVREELCRHLLPFGRIGVGELEEILVKDAKAIRPRYADFFRFLLEKKVNLSLDSKSGGKSLGRFLINHYDQAIDFDGKRHKLLKKRDNVGIKIWVETCSINCSDVSA